MEKIIGQTTRYLGTEHPYLQGHEVRIIAVLKGAASPKTGEEGLYIASDEGLRRTGGVSALDRIEVQPWLLTEGRFGWTSSDPKAVDLACFAHLRNQG